MKYLVTFKDDKIGRTRDNAPVTFDARGIDELERSIFRHAASRLASRYPDIEIIETEAGHRGWIMAGVQTVAEFTVEEVED